ncbi:copper chaperone [Candidatus Dojkabacteria bacterium]|uniref:Copper chaperone n=1 Tax=Candidatus Dojkabacteria bacterium TaxID=2099670 RepID=A0A5C7JAT0_9BACT|nr:MAG: copper chaperone [Candidatus Dojkabacteria bacterium]
MKKIKLDISGMHCSSCAMNIDFDLEDLEGVKTSKTSYAKQVTEVEFDEAIIDEVKISEQVKKTGYSSKLASN